MTCVLESRAIKRSCLAGAFLSCLLAGAPQSWGAESVVAAPTVSMVLRTWLNTQDKGDVFVERTSDQDFLIKVQDLKDMGFKDPPGSLILIDGDPFISLRSMQGVNFEFQEQGLTLNITAEPHLMPGQRLGSPEGQRTKARGAMSTTNSAFANYALTASGGDALGTTIGFAGEMGVRVGDYLLLSDGSTTQAANGERKFTRLMTSLTHDDREQLRRIAVGDFFTPSRDFSTGIALGGISVSKLFGLNPYFVQFPTSSVGGTVALPSDLEVYLDGQRIRTAKLQPGEFEIRVGSSSRDIRARGLLQVS